MIRWALPLLLLPYQAGACGLALIFAIDVSLSVNDGEYQLQMGGLSRALQDRSVVATLEQIEGGVSLALIQWSGQLDQEISHPWRLVRNRTDLSAFSSEVARTRRAFATETAPGSVIDLANKYHDQNPHRCLRAVTDVSGDGVQNTGPRTRLSSAMAAGRGQTINGLVILGDDPDPEDFYRPNVIAGPDSFLEVATGFDDFQRAMRDKLLRELPSIVAQN